MTTSSALNEEVEALKAIYDNDLKCDGSKIVITLFPLQEKEKKEIYVQLDLCLVCSEVYPEKEPDLSLRNVKGLSDGNLEALYRKLSEMAKSLRGEVMIYNLAYFVQEFLSENNKPGKKSCYEEMIIRKEQQRQELYKSEVHKKKKMIKDIQERHKEMLQSTENDSSNESIDECDAEQNEGDMLPFELKANSQQTRDRLCEHRKCKYMQFNNKVLRGRCIEHEESSVVYCAIDNMTGDQLLLREWILKSNNKESQNYSGIEKILKNIQSDVVNLKKLNHENLISYIDFKYSFERGEWLVYLLQEYITSINLNVFIEKSTDIDVNFIRYILFGILNGLEYLHSNDIVHGCLEESSIHLTSSGIVKLSGYGVKRMIDVLHYSCTNGASERESEKFSVKSDILKLGLLLLKVLKVSTSDKVVMVPDFQPPVLKEFVEKCLIENEEGRWTARKLLNHKFFKVRATAQNVQKRKFSSNEADVEIRSDMEKPYDGYDVFFDANENANSRLTKEFKILNHLGCGSFGKVLKVKNKLDGSVYAIKAIRLNTKNKLLDKKMIREVKLLSKLNHENIVRYYTSWIETDSDSTDNEFVIDSDVADGNISKSKSNRISALNFPDENDDEDDEEDDEEDDGGFDSESSDEVDSGKDKFGQENGQSSYVVFLNEGGGNDAADDGDLSAVVPRQEDSSFVEPNKTMYIQMEFCEKSTLRIAINDTDQKLCDDKGRLWRLLREIVEGLAYVHGQGMIHRDLKPENIFLDSSDHVKIGDFGLATVSVVSKCFWSNAAAPSGGGDNEVSSQNVYDGYHTGRVGTSLYVAPELDKTFGKSFYNKKVDIYSLGIIFFEMCNGRFNTDMERIETLLNLRKYEIILPSSWDENLPQQRNLVKMLLNHDPKSRPSCQEILEGNHLPPAEFEYEHLQEMMKQTLTNSKSKAYKYLISSCFDQEVRIEDDITYQWENVRSEKQYFLLDLVKERLENLLKKHGAMYFSVPLLLPQNQGHNNLETNVKLMTHSGSIVNLPYDLRIPFARFVACKAFTRLRRYVIERVFRERKVHGLHPKEQYECAFDLVTPSSCIENAELEVLSLIKEIINDFRSLRNRNCIIRLNHSFLLKAVLVHFNSEKRYSDVFKVLSNAKENKYYKSKLQASFQGLGIQSSNSLINLILKEDSLSGTKRELLSLMNKRGKTLDVLNQAFHKLHSIVDGAEKLDINVPIKICLGVVCNSEHCSDIMFDVAYRLKRHGARGKREGNVTLMSGCRYDGLIANFRRLFELTAPNSEDDQPSAVGLTIYLDKVVAILKEDDTLSEYVVICSFGSTIRSRAKDSMTKTLWEAGIKCYVEESIQTLEELTEYCRENKITHIINLKDEESGHACVMTWDSDKNRYLEKRMSLWDVPDYILKHSKPFEPPFSRQSSESQARNSLHDALHGNQNVNIHFISDEKFTSTQRRRYESQIRGKISSMTSIFSNKTRLEIIGVPLNEQKTKEIAIGFKSSDSPSYGCMGSLSDRNVEKKFLAKIHSKMRNLCVENSKPVIILYSIPSDKWQFIIDA